jgi:exodeoxyribonuclease VII large subunit
MAENQQDLLSRLRGERKRVLTVSELTANIKFLLESEFKSIWVAGEVSNVRIPSSGHCYLTLKDAGAQIAGVVWRTAVERLRFRLEDGMRVIVRGSLTVYEPRGNYQMVIDKIEPEGVGALQMAFQQLKERLQKEGLFDVARKRPIPFLPRRIGIVTSPTGAAIHDMLNVIGRRFPGMGIVVAPVRVQGEGAREEIAAAIRDMNLLSAGRLPGLPKMEMDVMIVGRGGGSLEDLWAFNEEIVAKSIVASEIPVISAVGHEIDFTIADFVADLRALTPSEAGEKVVPRKDQLLDTLAIRQSALTHAIRNRLLLFHRQLDSLARSYAFRQPIEIVRREQQRLDDISTRVVAAMTTCLAATRQKVAGISGRLDSLSPLKVLSRGYSVTTKNGRALKDASEVSTGDEIETRLHKGRIRSLVRNRIAGEQSKISHDK